MSVCDRERERGVTTQLTWFIHILTIHALPFIGKQHNWSWGNYPWLPWPAEELGHDCNNSADTPLTTVRKGQTESSVQQSPDRTPRPHKTSRLSNASRIPVIGALFQLASESQMLLTFLGNSCLNDHSQHMSSSSLRSLVRRRRHKQTKKLFDKETDNPEIFPAVAIKEWQLWPHASVSANKSIIYVQWYIFCCLVSLDC